MGSDPDREQWREFCQLHQADIEILSDSSGKNRPEKKQAIANIKSSLEAMPWQEKGGSFTGAFLDGFLSLGAVWSASTIEFVREQTISLLKILVEHAKYFPSSTYEDLVDVIGTRLGKRQTERSPAFEEPSEELRIAWLDVADLLVNHIPDDIRAIATARILDIVKLAVQDPSPDAVRKGGGILNALAQTCPREMALCGNIPMNLAIQLLHYKHAHTRVVGLQAACNVGLAIPASLTALFESNGRQAAFPALVYDGTANVRNVFSDVLEAFMTKLPARYRYEHAAKIMPLMLAAVADEIPSVADQSWAKLHRVGLVCAQDMVAAGVLEEMAQPEELAARVGLENVIHQCFKGSLKQVMKEIYELRVERRLRALGVFRVLCEYSFQEDLYASHKEILDCLFNVYCNGLTNDDVVQKVLGVLNVLGSKIPSSAHIYYLSLRFQEEELLHAETLCLGTKGLSVASNMLGSLISGAPEGSLTQLVTDHLLNIWLKPYFLSLLEEDEELALSVAQVMLRLAERQSLHDGGLLTESVKVKVLWFEAVLFAATTDKDLDAVHLYYAQDGVGSNTSRRIIEETVRLLVHRDCALGDAYGRYLQDLLAYVKKKLRREQNFSCWTGSSIHLRAFEVMMCLTDTKALEDEEAMETLLEIMKLAGSKTAKGNGKPFSLGYVTTRTRMLRMLQCVFVKGPQLLREKPYPDWIMKNIILPGLSTFEEQAVEDYHVALLESLEQGVMSRLFIENDALEEWLGATDAFLHSPNEAVKIAALKLRLAWTDIAFRCNREVMEDVCKRVLLSTLERLAAEDPNRRSFLIKEYLTERKEPTPGSIFSEPDVMAAIQEVT